MEKYLSVRKNWIQISAILKFNFLARRHFASFDVTFLPLIIRKQYFFCCVTKEATMKRHKKWRHPSKENSKWHRFV